MISRPFLTSPDTDRLEIRGSRDPLGIAVLWSHVGRHLVGNLTTASASVRGFTSTMLGYHFAEELAPHDRDRESFRLKAFLKFEQLCAYARARYNLDGNLRGIRDVRMKLATGRPIAISADSAGQILANQKIYGLWGLYSVPSKASDLLSDSLALTSRASHFLERKSLRALRNNGIQAQIARILTADKTRVEPDGKDAQLFQALAIALSTTYSAADRDFYRRHLVIGEFGKCHLQPVFAELMETLLPPATEFKLDSLKACIAEADRLKQHELVFRLRNIQHLEAVQVPMALLFAFAQARDGAPFETVAKEVSAAWVLDCDTFTRAPLMKCRKTLAWSSETHLPAHFSQNLPTASIAGTLHRR